MSTPSRPTNLLLLLLTATSILINRTTAATTSISSYTINDFTCSEKNFFHDENEAEETDRRQLLARRRGVSYYNCYHHGRANPYRQGCSFITSCACNDVMVNICPIINLADLLLYPYLITRTTPSLPLLPITSKKRTHVYIVHVQHPDGPVELLTHEDRESWYHSFLPNNTLDNDKPRMVCTYSIVMSGFAAHLTPDEVKAMESMPGFVFAHIDKKFRLRTTRTPAFLGLDQ